MFVRVILLVFLLIVASVGAVIYGRNSETTINASAQSVSQNIGIYSRSVAYYAGTNATVTGPVADASLALPLGYTKLQPWVAYVQNGNAWVYLPSGLQLTPARLLSQVGAPGTSIGIKAGTVAKDATGTVVVGSDIGIPAAIPDGVAIMLAQKMGPKPAPPAPMPTTAQPPAPTPPVNPVPPVAIVSAPYSTAPLAWSCCVTPPPPAPPPAPPPPPPPPPPQQPPLYVQYNQANPVVDYVMIPYAMSGGHLVSQNGQASISLQFTSSGWTIKGNCRNNSNTCVSNTTTFASGGLQNGTVSVRYVLTPRPDMVDTVADRVDNLYTSYNGATGITAVSSNPFANLASKNVMSADGTDWCMFIQLEIIQYDSNNNVITDDTIYLGTDAVGSA